MNDTHPEVERVQIQLLREAGIDRRAKIGSMLTNQARWRTRQSIERANPGMSPVERELLLVELLYGADLASRVRKHALGGVHGNS